jgi:seryl-tRNA synthetase
MLDLRLIRADPAAVERALADKGGAELVHEVAAIDERRRALVHEADELKAERNRASAAIAEAKRRGEDTAAEVARQRDVGDRIKALDGELRAIDAELQTRLAEIPNLPHPSVPPGKSDAENVEVRRWGTPRAFGFEPRAHEEVGEALGLLDLPRAARMAKSRFAVLWGSLARFSRGLAQFMLDLHTREHGYTEYAVPHLVSRETMTGTGQLPKFEEDLFATTVGGREMFLIPTAEVPLTNLVAREVLDERRLPLALTARTPCYRGEAGSYGRDTRGILRLHQFDKVELVRICRDEEAAEQLELMLGHVEECLKRLELSYRVVLLPAGDIGFSARKTYDVEVWLPGSDSYREISSVSDCGTFQGRRAAIRYRTGRSRRTAATLNGSGLPIGRTVAALLEQGQQPDGSVLLPQALARYTGFRRLLPGGATE